jgi:hypothetical protein
MYSFKGFVSIPALENRSNNQNSPVGELSANSLTFSKDIKNYPVSDGSLVVSCFSSRSSVNNNNAFTPPTAIIIKVQAVASWVKTRQLGLPGTEAIADFTLAFNSQWSTSIGAIEIGPMVNTGTNRSFPSYLAFVVNEYSTETNLVKIWFSDAAFTDQYDEYSITIIPPVANLTTLLGSYTAASLALANETPVMIAARVQTARASAPETVFTVERFDFYSSENSTLITPTYWTALVYGPRGNFTDAIRAAVADYIATNSTAAVTSWKAVLPDVYRTTEFIVIPSWSKMAVLDRALTSGVYSPVCSLNDEIAYLKSVVSEYSPTHVGANAQVLTHPYKCLTIGVIGNIQNRGNKFKLTDMYPDYINVSTTSPDFGRMSVSTQGLAVHLSAMLVLAETMQQFTELPTQYRRLIRNGILYITVSYENVTFLVAAKNGLAAQP